MRKFTQIMGMALVALMLIPVTAKAINTVPLEGEIVSFLQAGSSEFKLVSFDNLAPNNVAVKSQEIQDGGYNFYIAALNNPGEGFSVYQVEENDGVQDTTLYDITLTKGNPLLVYRGETEFDLQVGEYMQFGQPEVHIREWSSSTQEGLDTLEMDETVQAAWMEREFGLPWAAEIAEGDYFLTIIDKQLTDVAWTVTSSDEAVVEARLGVLSPLSPGEATISIKWEGNDYWNADSIVFIVRVSGDDPIGEKQMPEMWFETEGYYAYLNPCEPFQSPKVQIVPEDLEVIYTSSDPTIAAVDSLTGEVDILAVGEVKIQATFFGNEEYDANEAAYDLYIEDEPEKIEPELGFIFPSEDNSFYVQLGMEFESPQPENPKELTLAWRSSNEEVATVDEEGNLNIVGIGQATISVEFPGDLCYTEASAEYTLIVEAPELMLRVFGKEVTMDNARDILGDGKVSYDLATNTLIMDNLVVDCANKPDSAKTVVECNNEVNGSMSIRIQGKCAFTNVDAGFVHPIGIRFWGNNTDTLICASTARAIESDGLWIEGLYAEFSAIADITVNADELHVKENGHLLATAGEKGYAINLAELDLGDNIQILTKGVEFAQIEHDGWNEAGFFTDADHTMPAKEVEIGKAPVVVADDVVTTIDFTQTQPDGSEEVVVSLGVNDTFNEETGQLEISTALTDEQVSEALENLVPGSSAFVAALPGTITFDVPAGKGTIDIQCMTLPGYTLNVKIEGKEAIKVTQPSLGWARVEYDVETPVHVVLYLHAEAPATAPGRIRANDDQAALCIQAIKITPEKAPQGITEIEVEPTAKQKIIYDGQLYILHNGHIFNAQGTMVK